MGLELRECPPLTIYLLGNSHRIKTVDQSYFFCYYKRCTRLNFLVKHSVNFFTRVLLRHSSTKSCCSPFIIKRVAVIK